MDNFYIREHLMEERHQEKLHRAEQERQLAMLAKRHFLAGQPVVRKSASHSIGSFPGLKRLIASIRA
jgi:hypothetical protein